MSSTDQTPIQIGFKAKFLLVFFGMLMALLLFEAGLWIINRGKSATDFDTVDDLRSSLETEGHDTDSQGGGVSLKAIISPHVNNDIIYDLRPGLDVQFQRAHVTTNSCGMRGPERPVAKDPDTFRIALLGDSFAFGWGVEQKESFAQRLEDNLNQIYKKRRKIEVLNFGVPGYSTFQEVNQFLDKGAQFNPDAIVVFFIQNDFGPPFFIRNIGNQSLVPSTQIAQIAMKLLDPKAPEKELLKAGLDPNHSLAALADYASAQGIPLFLTINPKSDWKNYYKQLWILKKRKDIRYMNLRDSFVDIVKRRNIPTPDLTLSFDPHPSPLRHAIYGDIMTPYFMDVIPR